MDNLRKHFCLFLTATVIVLCFSVCSANIVQKKHVTVVYGEDAEFSCSLPDATGAKQVTWERRHDQNPFETMATFSERFQTQLADSYIEKINVTLASLNATTIVLKKVTFADEACYRCRFNVYPSGTKGWSQCISVEGLSETTASEASHSPSLKDVVMASCSATGNPAPTISWRSEGEELSHYSRNFTVLNHDGSATTTSNLTLPMLEFRGEYVECVTRTGNIEKMERINLPGDTKTTITASRLYISSALVVVIFAASCIVIAVHRWKKKQEKNSAGTNFI